MNTNNGQHQKRKERDRISDEIFRLQVGRSDATNVGDGVVEGMARRDEAAHGKDAVKLMQGLVASELRIQPPSNVQHNYLPLSSTEGHAKEPASQRLSVCRRPPEKAAG
ncbi:uncharacterized protein SPSK_10089 [Sporothrix schenckii 1099-18]|uniref:Uncharacterized protein n=1 Tax=Sporothrix schenckii 1099-18 TaxID=1397361 RepID=A0A0F2MCS0_SPOSC|nr:uncharacterized protein SPSK_10089 [Sporothrix schenckii 1099-18]KJR85941.1 hypothetical protein SPSK_10089 [Sporothrix schenckii 1099-18]